MGRPFREQGSLQSYFGKYGRLAHPYPSTSIDKILFILINTLELWIDRGEIKLEILHKTGLEGGNIEFTWANMNLDNLFKESAFLLFKTSRSLITWNR